MDISNFSLTEIASMFFSKLSTMLNMPDLTKIDLSNITGTIITLIITFLTSVFVLWLIKAIGLYTMAKNNGDKYAFLAFIPYGCLYTKGKIVGKTKLFGIDIDKTEYILPLLLLAMFLPFTKSIAFILFAFFYFGILYRLYQKQVPNFAIILLIFSILIPILKPFFIFFIRNSNQ